MANTKLNFIGGIVVGAALGVVTGLLAAPTSGKQTRKKLKKKSRKYSKDAVRAVRQYLAGQNDHGQRQLEGKVAH
jgi:gas vesicle protein